MTVPDAPPSAFVPVPPRPAWVRGLWLAAGLAALVTGLVGIVLPLLPTTPFVLLAAFCWSRGCRRCEAWMLAHPRWGPMIADWRRHRAIPRRARQWAFVMMAVGSVMGALALPARWAWLPAACCAAVAVWMARLPTREQVAGAVVAARPATPES